MEKTRGTTLGKSGFRITDEKPDVLTYRDRDISLLEKRSVLDDRWVRVEVPMEQRDGICILRPWNIWCGEVEYWRPEYDDALTPEKRLQICKRVAAWLKRRGDQAQLIEALPTKRKRFHIENVSYAAMKTLLEFLLQIGLRLPETKSGSKSYPGSSDPMEVFRGKGCPRKWFFTQGGEYNVHVEGRIPVKRVLDAFDLPCGEAGEISVNEKLIEGAGGEVWDALIWASE